MPTLDEAIAQAGGTPVADPLDAAVTAAGARTAQVQQLRTSVVNAVKQNPDDYAQAKQLSKASGVPAPVLARNLPEAQETAKVGEFDKYLDKSPVLAGHLSNPEFANVAHDDTEGLSALEAAVTVAGAPGFRATPQPEANFVNYLQGLWTSAVSGGTQAKLGLEMQAQDLLGDGSIEDRVRRADLARKFARAQGEAQSASPAFDSATAQGVYSGLASTLQQAPGVALSVATRSPTPSLGLLGIQTEAQAYGKYRERGGTPGEATAGGIGEGAVEVATELLPMGFLVKKFGKSGAREFLGGLLARELPSEQVATLAQDAIDTAIANPDKTWSEYLAERPDAAYQTALATIVQSGVMGGANLGMTQLEIRSAKADKANAQAEQLAAIAQMAAASKLRERDPESFQTFIDAAAKGGPIENLYIDATALQQSGIDLEALAQVSPSTAAQVTEALATGGDVVIPLGEYTTKIVGSPLDAKLTPHLRTSEDALSQDEAEKFAQGQADEFKKVADQAMEEKAGDDAWLTSAKNVETKLLGELESTGRFTKDVNTAYATIMRDFYVATASRLGITPEETFARYPIKIRAEGVAGGEQLEQGTAEEAIRETFRALPSVQLGKAYPIAVSFGGRTQKFMARQDALARGKHHAALHLVHLKRGKLTAGDPEASWIIQNYKLDGKNKLTPEGLPRAIGDQEAEQMNAALDTAQVVAPKAQPEKVGFVVRNKNGAYLRGFSPKDGQAFFGPASEAKAFESQEAWEKWRDAQPVPDGGYWASVFDRIEHVANAKQNEQNGTHELRQSSRESEESYRAVGGTPASDWLEKTRLKRKDGRPVVLYRGTAKPLDAGDFDEGSLGHNTGHPSSSLGVWFTGSRDDAGRYGPLVEPFHLDLRNPKVYKADTLPEFDTPEEWAALREQLKAAGHDGVMIDLRELGGPVQFVAFTDNQAIYPQAPKPIDVSTFFQITPEQAMDTNVEKSLPTDPLFGQAVMNTPGAEITEDGLKIRLVRFQKPEQEGARAIRTGVFYLPFESKNARYYDNTRGNKAANWYGGAEKLEAPTLIRKPLFVKGATGGAAPQAAYDALKGKGAGKRLRDKVVDVATARFMGDTRGEFREENIKKFLREFGGDPSMAREIMHASREGNTLSYALQEHIIAHAVRDAGYDAVVGYSKGKSGPFISEVFDVREQTYPSHVLSSEVHEKFERSMGQTPEGWSSVDTSDPSSPDPLKPGKGTRGTLTVPRDITQTTPVITLFKNADLSTLLHEMGHFQLEVLSHIAQQPGAPVEITKDFDAVMKWFGTTPAEWNKMTLDEKRPMHEKFARGFEAYLFEGESPNAELRSLFQRFRAWMMNVYRSIKALNVEISDEIRGVFDRLIATEESIEAAQALRNMTPLFKNAEEMGDPALYADARQQSMEATQTAMDELSKRSLRDMKWATNARSRVIKELQADAKAKRDAVTAEIKAEVRQQPVYAAQRFLRFGELPEGTKVTGAKLDLDALKAMYGEGPAAPWRYLSVGKSGLAGKEGLPPDTVAEMFGFTSGDQLVREILAAEPEADVVEALTDRRMLERFGDITSPAELAKAADEAIHNEARGRFVATELKALTKAAGPARAIAKAAKQLAETLIARKKVKDIKPNAHAMAETRAAKEAQTALAANELDKAAAAKRNQLVQNYSTRAAYDALAEIDRITKYLRKFNKESTREKLDRDYIDQIDQLLERYDLRAVSQKQIDKRRSLLEWLESQREQGFEPDVPPELIADAQRLPYRELTLEQLRGLSDTIKQIEHLGRLKNKLLTAKDEREFAATRDAIAASIEKHAQTVRDNRTRNTTGAMLKTAGNQWLAMHRKMTSLAREMDGFEDGGPMWEYFIRSMNAAGDKETARRAEATKKLMKLVEPLMKEGGPMGGKGTYFPTLGDSFNREERIAIALNLGNAGNMQRLLDGEGWTMDKLQPLLDTITPEEADFVQGVWDFFEGYRPEIGAKEERVYGKQPNWVDPVPVTLGGKQLRGGYYPIKYDAARSGKAEQHADADAAKAQMRGAYTSATTRRSFTKNRATAVKGRPLLYSLAGLYQGTNEVIHDLSWHEWLIDVNRLLRSLDAPIRTHYGPETVRAFKKSIEDIAAGDVPAANVFERGLNHIRTGATIAGLGWNLTTSLLQPLGLTQSMVRIGPKWVAKGIGQWIKHPLATVTEVYEKSDMMKLRGQTMQREINEIQNQVRDSKVGPVRATFFTLIQKMQLAADIPTWVGQYEKSVAEGETEERAAELADQAVIDAQGGGQVKDLSEIQRGHPALKLFTNFYSFFNVAYNLGVEKTKQKGRNPKQYPGLVLDYLLLYSVPAALATLLKTALMGGGDDEDSLGKRLIADQISYLLGTMVGLRELTAAAQAATGVEQFKSSYGGPAGLRLFQEIDKLGDQLAQGEIDAALLKAANNVAGIMFHYPSGQINRTAEGAVALMEGQTQNPAALLTGAPKQ